MHQAAPAVRADPIGLWQFNQFICQSDPLENLSHGVRAGENHFTVLPRWRWAPNSGHLFDDGLYLYTGAKGERDQSTAGLDLR